MQTVIIEATNGPQNWGKFLIGRFDSEWRTESKVMADSGLPGRSILSTRGWSKEHIIVFDLETNEGAAFRPGGNAHSDLEKHKIWVCPLFEPFLGWLYTQDLSDLAKLPKSIDLPDASFEMYGYRRPGPEGSKNGSKNR